MTLLLWFPLVALASYVYEWIAVRAFYALEGRNPKLAGLLEGLLESFAWLFVIVFVDVSKWLAIPSVLGTIGGTYIGVLRERRKHVPQNPQTP